MIFVVILWIIIASFYLIQKYVFSSNNDIKTIYIKNKEVYINTSITKILEDSLIGRNYFVAKINKMSIMDKFNSQNINIINNLTIDKQWQTGLVNIYYRKPTIVLSLSWQIWWYISWYFFELDPRFSIYSGNIVININIYSWQDISSIFFETRPEALIQQVQNIYSKISVKNNFWIPSAQKIWIITIDDKLVYFDIKKNIFDQVKKFNFVKNNYKNYSQVKEIDVWTIEDYIFIK